MPLFKIPRLAKIYLFFVLRNISVRGRNILSKVYIWANSTRSVDLRLQSTNRTSSEIYIAKHTLSGTTKYILDYPTPQNAINIFAGEWSSRFPADLAVEAGNIELFDDPRVHALASMYDALPKWHVLELGPLEGGHTSIFHGYGCHITSIEANERSFLKCLITKELLGLNRARFLLGDYHKYLSGVIEHYDLVFASGVLYHSTEPLALLESISHASNRIAIWTHYFCAETIASRAELSRVFSETDDVILYKNQHFKLRRRFYREALHWTGFCGGPEPWAYWLTREDLLNALALLGFTRILVVSEDILHINGPCIYITADRES